MNNQQSLSLHGHNGGNTTDDSFKGNFVNENCLASVIVWLKSGPSGNRPLPKLMLTIFYEPHGVTRPQWVKVYKDRIEALLHAYPAQFSTDI